MMRSRSPSTRTLAASLVLLSAAGCGGAGGAPQVAGGGAVPLESPAPVLLRVDTDADLAAVAAEAAADGWALARTHRIPRRRSPGGVLCVLEPAGAGAAADPAVAASGKKAATWSAETVQRVRFAPPAEAEQSSSPIFDDEVDFAALRTQVSLETIGATDPRLADAGTGVVVAVLDGGFDLRHEAVAGRIAAGGSDAVDGDSDPEDLGNGIDDDANQTVDDVRGHGTAVAALVLAVAPQATVLPIRVLDDEGNGTTETVAVGLIAAMEAGVEVVNLSVGVLQPSQILRDLVEDARAEGIAVVASAGNEGKNQVLDPAAADGAIAVGGATDGRYDEDSNHGETIDVSAPMRGLVAPYPGTSDGYGRWTGTSMSAALYSGAVAALRSLDARSTPLDRSDALLSSAAPYLYVPPFLEGRVGRGILDLRPLLR